MSGFMVMRKAMTTALPAALAAGGLLLLSACGSSGADTAASKTSATTTTTTTTVTSAPSTSVTDESAPATSATASDDMAPVDCGAVSLGTQTKYHLIAAATATGIVGCTEAFNVVDEFVKLPQDKRAEASLGNVTLPSGWSCTVDDGESANLSCEKDGLSLHAEEA